jgi:hypothetical protein
MWDNIKGQIGALTEHLLQNVSMLLAIAIAMK